MDARVAREAMTRENRCFRGCCVGTSDVRLDHVVRQASASVDARARWRPADESAVILRGDVLRAGPLSTVYYGRFGKRAIAIKRPKLRTTREIDRYHAELGLMLELAHEHVVAVVGARAAPPNYELFFPFMENGAVDELMYGHGWTPTWQAVLKLAREVSAGMAYLHSRGVVHRDVKPGNVLLDASWTAKIGDFGLAERESDLRASLQAAIYSTEDAEGKSRAEGKWIAGENGAPSGGFQKQHMVGSILYMSPEVLMRRVSGYGADVYAYGVTLCEIATGTVPFSDRARNVALAHTVLDASYNEQDLAKAIASERLRPVLPGETSGSRAENVPEGLNELISRAWAHEEPSRPMFTEISRRLEDVVETYAAARGLRDVAAVWLPPATDRAEAATAAECALKEPIDWRTQEPAFATPSEEARESAAAFSAGVFSTPGARGADKMEDRHIVVPALGGHAHAHLFAVFDGHRGHEAAEFAMSHVERAVRSEWGEHGDDVGKALAAATTKLDVAFRARFDAIKAKEMSASRNAQQGNRNPGCTAVIALLWGDRLCVANAGDCRAVLSRADAPVALSVDYDAQSNVRERERIDRAFPGALRLHDGVWRVGDAGVAVTRALGDADAKAFGVVAEPETTTTRIDVSTDDCVVLACDGLWDVVTNDEALAMIKDTVKEPSMCAKRLGSEALTRLSGDNITVLVGFLRGARTCENVSWARAF